MALTPVPLNYLIETLKNDIVGGHDVDHKIFGHRLDLKVKGSEELLVESGMRSDVCAVRKNPSLLF